ncbi:MAG: hypothetical protein U0935_18295 [Pirellulales bacterium]
MSDANDDSTGRYGIEDDQPGLRLRLSWQGPRPRPWLRWLPYGVVLAGVALLAAILVGFLGTEIDRWLTLGPEQWSDLIPLGLILSFGAVMVGSTIKQLFVACHDRGIWTELDWDQSAGLLRARYSGVPPFDGRTWAIPLGDIDSLQATLGPEGEGRLQIRLRVETQHADRGLEAHLEVADVDQRAEALDLLFRMARIAGLPFWMVTRHAPQELAVNVYHSADAAADDVECDDDEDDLEEDDLEEDDEAATKARRDGDAWRADRRVPGDGSSRTSQRTPQDSPGESLPVGQVLRVPEDRSYANYRGDAAPRIRASRGSVADFSPSQLANDVEATKVEVWEPGSRVEVQRPAWSMLQAVSASLALGGALGVAACWPLFGIVLMLYHPLPVGRVIVFLVAALLGTVAGWILVAPRLRSRQLICDWRRGSVIWSVGGQTEERSLRDIECVSIGPPRVRRITPRGQSVQVRQAWSAEVKLEFSDGDASVIETDGLQPDYNVSLQKLLPFTAALAHALGVPWRVVSAQRSLTAPGGWYWTRLRVVGVLLAVVVLGGAVAARFVTQWATEEDERQARANLQQQGVKVVDLAERTLPGGYVLRNVQRVEFPAGIDDAQLTALLPLLAALPRPDLDLHGAAVTDQGVRPLGQLRNLVAVDLSNTPITNAGVDDFYRLFAIEAINLSGTRIGDEAVSMCAMNRQLRVLQLNDTRVSNACMSNLRVADRLLYLEIIGTRVDEEGAGILSGAVHGLTIRRQADAGEPKAEPHR